MANKKKKRRAFPIQEVAQARGRRLPDAEVIDADDPGFGIFGWFRNPGVRETIESIIIAILLAFMFKTYEAEAFVIPTGSMAPSLQGEHLDLDCGQCGYRYLTGAAKGERVEKTVCPICNYRTVLDPQRDTEHRVNSGDRILVNKFIYDFNEPERFDVIVFKYPNNAKQNYIKRLIGLPGDNILIENGDIFLMEEDGNGGWNRKIARKPPAKVRQVLVDVDDTKFIGGKLKSMKWPSRWAQWGEDGLWSRNENESLFIVDASEDEQWLRYRHLVPRGPRYGELVVKNNRAQRKLLPSDWTVIKGGELPADFDKPQDQLPAGRLISDTMSYNTKEIRGFNRMLTGFGNHWVGDLGIHAWVDIESATGELLLDVVEGGAHFTCRIDVASGKATLSCDDPDVVFGDSVAADKPTGQTNLATGSNEILMVNADDQIALWVNGSLVEFDDATYSRGGDMPLPRYSAEDPGDAEPVAIGARNLSMTVSRLKVVRDIYYSSVNGDDERGHWNANESGFALDEIEAIMSDPEKWNSEPAIRYFSRKRNQDQPMFSLEYGETRDKDQFFPMGDNSTQSLDARVWPSSKRYVERDLLIGRAICIYWPHSLNEPIPYFPNFGKMKFIR